MGVYSSRRCSSSAESLHGSPYAGGVFGLAYGTVIAAARIAQGAHFFTDCLWSLGVILADGFGTLLLRSKNPPEPPHAAFGPGYPGKSGWPRLAPPCWRS